MSGLSPLSDVIAVHLYKQENLTGMCRAFFSLLAAVGVVVNNFSSLFSETTAPNTSKLYVQLPYIGVFKHSSLHVDPIVDVDFIGL